MRIIVLDYSGHMPQADLAKAMSIAGNKVLHIRCTDYVTGNADFNKPGIDDAQLEFRGISAGFTLNRYDIIQRLRHEYRLSKKFAREIIVYSPDYVVLSNVPLICAYFLVKKLKRRGIKFVYWWQDVYSLAINRELHSKYRLLGVNMVAEYITSLEKYILNCSTAIVAISEKFCKLYEDWELDLSKLHIYPNWSPPEEFVQNTPIGTRLPYSYFLYAGTLGLKHNPKILVSLADNLVVQYPDVRIVVVSQGLGREFLEKAEQSRDNIVLSDFLPLVVLRDYLDGALGVIAILEPSASDYSVPSKVMTYFCAGKAIIAAVPKDNQVAQYILESGAGFVVNSIDPSEITEAAVKLIEDESIRCGMQSNSRDFAESHFSGQKAAAMFLGLMK